MTFDVNYYVPKDAPGALLMKAMAHLMWPWSPGLIEIWMEDDWVSMGKNFIVTCSLFPDERYTHLVGFNVLFDEWELGVEIGKKAAEFFLSLSEPLTNNLILGEN